MKPRNESTGRNARGARAPRDKLGLPADTPTDKTPQDSSEPYRSLFAASLDAGLLTARDGRILAANAAACRMFGYAEQELIAAGRSLVVDSSDPHLAAALQERARTGKFHGELTFVRKDGTKFPGELSSAVFTDREGRQFTSMVIRDVTERKQAEKSLTFLRHSIDHAADTIVCVDREGRFVDVNETLCRRSGYSREELLAKTVHDLDPDFPAEVWPGFWEKLKQSGSLRFESRHRTKEGEVYPVEIAATYFEYEGKEYHSVFARDITERKWAERALKESEQKFRTIFHSASDGMFLADLETRRIVMCNAMCSTMLGYTQEELRNLDVRDLHPPDQAPYILEQFPDFARGRTGARQDTRFRRKDGTLLFTDLSPAPMTLAGRKMILVVIKDITERKQAEAALRQSHEQLRALSARVERLREEQRTRISREIHDQLGQLVTALKMDLRAIERKLPALGGGPAGAELAEKLAGAIQLSDDLIERMHDMAAELRPGLLDNLGLVAALQEEARRFQARTDIACAVAVAEPFPPVDAPTSTALYRIVQETLANVARHAQATSVQIRLAEAQGALLLEVHDNGKGISDAALADPKSLGLLGIRERAAALGGSVEVSGEPGLGTTVKVKIGGSRGAEEQRGKGAGDE
jgi:PAS domain S-box-containing protein